MAIDPTTNNIQQYDPWQPIQGAGATGGIIGAAPLASIAQQTASQPAAPAPQAATGTIAGVSHMPTDVNAPGSKEWQQDRQRQLEQQHLNRSVQLGERVEQATQAEGIKPWSELGTGGKIGRIAGIAGGVMFPGWTSRIPGTPLHDERQLAELQQEADRQQQLGTAEEEAKARMIAAEKAPHGATVTGKQGIFALSYDAQGNPRLEALQVPGTGEQLQAPPQYAFSPFLGAEGQPVMGQTRGPQAGTAGYAPQPTGQAPVTGLSKPTNLPGSFQEAQQMIRAEDEQRQREGLPPIPPEQGQERLNNALQAVADRHGSPVPIVNPDSGQFMGFVMPRRQPGFQAPPTEMPSGATTVPGAGVQRANITEYKKDADPLNDTLDEVNTIRQVMAKFPRPNNFSDRELLNATIGLTMDIRMGKLRMNRSEQDLYQQHAGIEASLDAWSQSLQTGALLGNQDRANIVALANVVGQMAHDKLNQLGAPPPGYRYTGPPRAGGGGQQPQKGDERNYKGRRLQFQGGKNSQENWKDVGPATSTDIPQVITLPLLDQRNR